MGHECVFALFGLLTPMHPNVHHSGVPKLHTPAPPSNEKSAKTVAQPTREMRPKGCFVRCGVRTHALSREPELKSGALDHSANLTRCVRWVLTAGPQNPGKTRLPRAGRTNSGRCRTAGKPRAESGKSADVPALSPDTILCHRNSLFKRLI